MATEPNTGLTWQEPGSLTTDALHNQVIDFVSIWVNCIVLAVGQAAPTGSEVEGDRYIVGTGAGVFAGHDDELAILRGSTWQFHAPPAAGVPIIKNLADNSDWECVAGVWAEKAGGGSSTLAGLTDVDLTGLADGDLLSWDVASSKFVPVTPGGGGGGMVLLGAVTAPPGGTATLSVSSIPSGYSALKVSYVGRSTKAAGYDDVRVNFNGDTGSNYNCQSVSYAGTGGYISPEVHAAYGNAGFAPAATAAANAAGSFDMMIADFSNTIFDKIAMLSYGLDYGTTSSGLRSIFWHPSTPAAITSVAVTMAGGNHVEGSKLYVYGLPT